MRLRAFSSILILLTIMCSSAFSQQKAALERIKRALESFEYRTVVQLADSLLSKKGSLQRGEVIEVYLMKGVSCFSLGDEAIARRSFFEILLVQNDYRPDSARISPKIIRLFEEVKAEFLRVAEQKRERQPTPKDTLRAVDERVGQRDDLIRGALLRSIILPGWGHLYRSDETKGWILSSASVVTVGAMAYFILGTASREKEYLNESDAALIDGRYERYNSFYKTRNALILTYAAVWVYAQLDLLMFSSHSGDSALYLSLESQATATQSLRLMLSIPLGP